MFSNLIDTRYHTDYRLMASSWMRNIWESHLLQINKSSEKLKKMSTESERARRFAQKISHIGLTNTLHAFPTALALIHGRYRCREASAARDTLTGETRRSQGARESFYDLFRDLHNHDKERDDDLSAYIQSRIDSIVAAERRPAGSRKKREVFFYVFDSNSGYTYKFLVSAI